MIFYSGHSRSYPQKFLVVFMFLLVITISGCVLVDSENVILCAFAWFDVHGDMVRRYLLAACLVVYFIRVTLMLFVFLQRTLRWCETIPILMIISATLLAIAYYGGNSRDPFNWADVLWLLLYLGGSTISTVSEASRYRWKRDPANAGKLYTGGLFKQVRHVNYTADAMLFTGLALLTHYPWMLAIPFIMISNFVFYLVPNKEIYLRHRYRRAFKEYQERTKALVPYIW